MLLHPSRFTLFLGFVVGVATVFLGMEALHKVREIRGEKVLREQVLHRAALAPHQGQVDVGRLIKIHHKEDVLEKRRRLLSLLFGDPTAAQLPQAKPVLDQQLARRHLPLSGHRETHVLRVEQEHGIDSLFFHHVPLRGRGRMVFYHAGHEGNLRITGRVLSALLEEGYDVVALAMPLFDQNPQPIVDVPQFGKLRLFHHDLLPFVPISGHGVKLFVQPVLSALAYAEKQGFGQVDLIGFSGGGWTTTLVAALDSRIRRSYPVAGTLPIFLRYDQIGDYEETAVEVYTIANYLELYLMGAFGQGRKQMQVLGRYDPCCNAAGRHLVYERILQERLRGIGGEFSVLVDESAARHTVWPTAMKKILEDLSMP